MNIKIESQDSDYLFENLIEYVNPPQETKILPVFKTNDFALYNNDSLEVMSRFPENYVDMIFADPPYMLSNDGFTCYAGKWFLLIKVTGIKSKGFENDLNFHETWIKECKRILKPEGTIWISGTYHSIYQCGYLLQKLELSFAKRYCLV